MKRIVRRCALVYTRPPGSPDSGNVVTRGIEGNVSDTNNGGSLGACKSISGEDRENGRRQNGRVGMAELDEVKPRVRGIRQNQIQRF